MSERIDARGLSCPEPVILTQRAAASADAFEVIVDNDCAVENITRFAQNTGRRITVSRQGDEYTLKLSK